MDYSSLEQFAWPFVLLVGEKIKSVSAGEKKIFWRNHFILSALIVLPSTILDWFHFGLPDVVYMSLIGSASLLYVIFIYKWRKYLNKHN